MRSPWRRKCPSTSVIRIRRGSAGAREHQRAVPPVFLERHRSVSAQLGPLDRGRGRTECPAEENSRNEDARGDDAAVTIWTFSTCRCDDRLNPPILNWDASCGWGKLRSVGDDCQPALIVRRIAPGLNPRMARRRPSPICRYFSTSRAVVSRPWRCCGRRRRPNRSKIGRAHV